MLASGSMVTVASAWSFALVVGVLTVTPGLDTAIIVRTSAVGAARQAWGVVAGIQTGTLVWGVLASAGVAALLTASPLAFEFLRLAGAAYLIWMGLRMLWGTRRPSPGGSPTVTDNEPGWQGSGFWTGWRRGMTTNMLNPKMGVFYAALLPQFIPAGASPVLAGVLLACVHIVIGTLWSTVLVLAARRLQQVLRRPAARRILDRATGTVITSFGVRLLVSSR